MNIDKSHVIPISSMSGDDAEDTKLLYDLFEVSKKYLLSMSWCSEIVESYYGTGVGGIFSVFLFKIIPKKKADVWTWIIVGDIPPAYISPIECKTPLDALEGYIYEMRKWIYAVKNNLPINKIIPVNAPPTNDYAEMLETRLLFLEKNILFKDK